MPTAPRKPSPNHFWDGDAAAPQHAARAAQNQFRVNGVDGEFLLELSEADFVRDLSLIPLQARKVVSRLRVLHLPMR